MREWLKKNNFLVRKIHSLLGIFPVGVFLTEHLITNSFATFGPEVYNEKIEWIQSMPYLFALEVGFIFVPLLFHALFGFVFLWAWKDNSSRYRYARNWLYTLQRVTGIIAFVFIGYHVWEFRIETALNGKPVDFELVANEMVNIRAFLFYIVGISATVFHFTNGIWSFLVHWGITVGPKSQRIAGYVCAGLGVALLYIGLDALWAFR
ncbi:MAG: succinate dehydrogenase cytochrome b558 subunit [Deltaproteobacteria bacterium]|nr:succinate dehydrogenase cytochrome b558 subunit [Deltaproteobacteria bacterium]MBI3017859.1 succinate dehydrogenase cytochrome b558 subunit [Deltaproteobacteria bacterium]